MRRILLLLVLCALAAPARAARGKTNQLLTVVTPVTKTTVPAHPHVNVIVRFNPTSDGYLLPSEGEDPANVSDVRLGVFCQPPRKKPFENAICFGGAVLRRVAPVMATIPVRVPGCGVRAAGAHHAARG